MAVLNCIAIKSSYTPLTFTTKNLLAVYSRSNLIGVNMSHSLTESLTHPLVHNILNAPTKRCFFTKKKKLKKGKLTTRIKCEEVSELEYFEQKFLLGAGRAM